MFNSYELLTRGIYPYNPASMPYVSWDILKQDHEHSHATDIIVNDSSYIVRIALAGYEKENIKVKTTQGKLIITADGCHDISRDLKVIEREIPFGAFRRVYELNNIDSESIAAKFENGVLSITLTRIESESADGERDIEF